MRTSYDSINVRALPAGGDLYMGYDDGQWPDADTIAQMYPGKTVVRITTNPSDNEGDMLDIEKGDARPQDAPGWIQRRRDSGHGGPLVYFPESSRSTVLAQFQITRVPLPGLFSAAYPGEGAVLQQPTDVGHQYASNAKYDTSVVIDYLPGIDPSPGPPPPPPEEKDMAVSPVINFKPDQLDTFQVTAGALWHKWAVSGVWHNEAIPLPTGFGPVAGTPAVSIQGGAVWVSVEDANGKEAVFFQTPTETTWNNAILP